MKQTDNKIKPIILDANKISLEKIKKQYKIIEIIDSYKQQLEDYFLIKNPKYKFIKDYKDDFEIFLKKFLKNKPLQKSGKWIYFPWDKKLIHCLDEKLLFETRTARNVYLITREEQKIFYQAKVGIAGLSVGSHIALTITLSGGAKNMKLADNDTISLSNLNRLRYPLNSLGKNKAVFCAERIYEMNPYANLTIYNEGITEKNIMEFLFKPKLDVLIEEMDNPYLKILVRELARKYRIPVIMAADNGDNIIVDVERYDLHSGYPILHGLLGKIRAQDFKDIKPADLPRVIGRIAGVNLATPRMLQSVLEVGKTIYSWPQLGNAATLCGAILTQLTRKIILGDKVKEGRIDFNADKLIAYIPKSAERQKQQLLKKLA
jgi:hypothetical protein